MADRPGRNDGGMKVGEAAAAIDAFDWARTPLGPKAGWPRSLRMNLETVLRSPLPIVLLWGETGVTLYNDAFAHFAGARHPGLMGAKVLEALPTLAPLNARALAAGLAGRSLALRDEPVILRGGGAPRQAWLNLDFSPAFGDDGAPAGVLGVVFDTSARVLAERRQAEAEAALASETAAVIVAEERLRRAQSAGGIGTFEWYPDSGRMEVSDEYRRIWGLGPDVAVTQELLVSLVDPELRGLTGPARLNDPKGALYYVEYRITRPDTGEKRWLARRGEMIGADAATGRRFVGVCFDVTDRRRTEAALRDLNATLEQRVAREVEERAKAEEALRQAQKMEAIGQLTGGIAHDFNNLLQGIVGSLDLLETRVRQGRTGDLARLVEGAMSSAKRAAALTHRLLAFSRRQPLDPKPVAINALVASMEALLRGAVDEAIGLELTLAEGAWPTLCDPNQLENALLNLAINARDAMPGGGTLRIETGNADLTAAEVSAERGVAPGPYVWLAVTDTGVGMSAEVLGRVFDPFFTTKPQGLGTGLGLSMIYGFARQSEGFVRIESEPGRGTTVKLFLPRRGGVTLAQAPRSPVARRLARIGWFWWWRTRRSCAPW